jgi:hypothetical protein
LKRQFIIIQLVSIFYTIIGMFFVEVMTKAQWSEHLGLVTLGSIALIAIYGWISLRVLHGNLFKIITVAILYIVYWFMLYFIWREVYPLIFPTGKVLTLGFLSMAMNMAYWWIIIIGGMIGYVGIHRQKSKEYEALPETRQVKRKQEREKTKKEKQKKTLDQN